MGEDSDRVFDVSKPHRASPSPTSRPVIVGHHPMTSDPMVTDRSDDSPPPPATEHKAIPVFGPDDEQPEEEMAPADSPMPMPEHPESVVAVAPEPEHSTHDEAPLAHDGLAAESHHGAANDYMAGEQSEMHQGGMPHHGPGGDLPPTAFNDQAEHHYGHIPADQLYIRRRRWPKVLLVLVILLVAGYLAIDSRLIKTSIKLPFHVFKQPAPAAVTPPVTATPPVSTVPSLPTGFANYELPNTTISFDYPTVWGAPTTTTEAGYSSRSTTAKTDGTYAYLTNFATNNDVQVVLTSAKYLPVVRTALYYDYLQWCVGTNDGQYYKSTLLFNTTAGVSTPSTIVCDEGPLSGVTKLDANTIVQLKTTNPDGSVLGDLYTQNLKDTVLPVLRVKDAASTNSVDIKQLLNTVDLNTPSTTSTTSTTSSDTTSGQ